MVEVVEVAIPIFGQVVDASGDFRDLAGDLVDVFGNVRDVSPEYSLLSRLGQFLGLALLRKKRLEVFLGFFNALLLQ